MTLLAIAAQHGLPAFYDDDAVSIGAGEGSRTWPLDALPASLADVDWTGLHDIPTVLVTGSNGKTTTVRLLAAMFARAGLRAGFSCTDGVFVDGEQVRARRLLRPGRRAHRCCATRGCRRRCWKPRAAACCAAAWRCATPTSRSSPMSAADHFGEYGVHDLSDDSPRPSWWWRARSVADDGVLVLNADDPLLVRQVRGAGRPLAWFALDHDAIPDCTSIARRAASPAACAMARCCCRCTAEHDLGDVAAMPLTMGGRARYNIANIAGAALVAACAGH